MVIHPLNSYLFVTFGNFISLFLNGVQQDKLAPRKSKKENTV